MRRRLKHLALFLILGAVINYALAMGFIWFAHGGEAEREDFWFNGAFGEWTKTTGMTRLEWVPDSGNRNLSEPREPPAWSRVHRIPRPLINFDEWFRLPNRTTRYEFVAGWPLRAVMYEYDYEFTALQANEFTIRSGIELPPRHLGGYWALTNYPRAIPLRIIPAGFALNTLLFASLAAMMWQAPGAIRRIRRRRANRCLKCGYPRAGLADHAPCPECGGKEEPAQREQSQQRTQRGRTCFDIPRPVLSSLCSL